MNPPLICGCIQNDFTILQSSGHSFEWNRERRYWRNMLRINLPPLTLAYIIYKITASSLQFAIGRKYSHVRGAQWNEGMRHPSIASLLFVQRAHHNQGTVFFFIWATHHRPQLAVSFHPEIHSRNPKIHLALNFTNTIKPRNENEKTYHRGAFQTESKKGPRKLVLDRSSLCVCLCVPNHQLIYPSYIATHSHTKQQQQKERNTPIHELDFHPRSITSSSQPQQDKCRALSFHLATWRGLVVRAVLRGSFRSQFSCFVSSHGGDSNEKLYGHKTTWYNNNNTSPTT